MRKAIVDTRKSRGRPRIDATQIGLRLPPDNLAALDAWIAQQREPDLSRPEAIRRLVELGLTVKPKARPRRQSNRQDGGCRPERRGLGGGPGSSD